MIIHDNRIFVTLTNNSVGNSLSVQRRTGVNVNRRLKIFSSFFMALVARGDSTDSGRSLLLALRPTNVFAAHATVFQSTNVTLATVVKYSLTFSGCHR